MNLYNMNHSNRVMIINEMIASLSVNGSNNKIIVNAPIPNLLINGLNNRIIIRSISPLLSNVIFNGNQNSIESSNTNFNKISNGYGNFINGHQIQGMANNFNVFNNFSNSSFNININGRNINNLNGLGNLNSQIASILNMVTNNTEMYNNEEEEEEPEENSEEDDNEDRRREIIKQRDERILNFDEFQYKHAGKYIDKIEEKCAICLDKFKGTDIVKLFYCNNHIFHKKCLLTWLKRSNQCPLCKTDFIEDLLNPGEEFVFDN